jgi:cytochrome b561
MSVARSHLTRALHLAVLLVVLHQLTTSLIMERPAPGEEADWPFLTHQRIGVVGVAILFSFWLWLCVRHRRETSLGAMFPWLSLNRLRALFAEILVIAIGLSAGRFRTEYLDAIPSAIHGLGLSLATFMAASGAAWFFFLQGSHAGRVAIGLHGLAGNLMWVYLIGHAAMAATHQALGNNVLSRMFWISRAYRSGVAGAE